jgi:hypothetical protein
MKFIQKTKPLSMARRLELLSRQTIHDQYTETIVKVVKEIPDRPPNAGSSTECD